MSNSILVIGGTGTIGRSLLELLQQNQASFKALVRDQEKKVALEEQHITTVLGSLGEWDSIKKALDGIDTAFLLTSVGPQSVSEQKGFIDHAKAAGVRKVVKISAVGARTGSTIQLAHWHGEIEDHLKDSGLTYVILRPHSFMQNAFMSLPTIKEQNTIYQSMGDSRIPLVDTRDVAKASYECLVRDDFDNQTFEITGPEATSYDDVAAALSEATGTAIKHVAIPPEAHHAAMTQAGLPDWLADDLTNMSRDWSTKAVHQPTNDLKAITGTQGRGIRDFAMEYASFFNA